MSRVVIIGGSGHVGTYLVPRLVSAGFEVVSVTRGKRAPYQPHAAWKFVRTVTLDREPEESAGAFGNQIRELRPDIVIDMICFTEASARALVDALRGQVRHFLHTGTIWVHGPSVEVPPPKCSRGGPSASTEKPGRQARLGVWMPRKSVFQTGSRIFSEGSLRFIGN